MTSSWDVIVLGAGIVGAACAFECIRRGMRTAIVESNGVGGGTTAAGMGHIVVMDDSPAQLSLSQYSQQLWHELAPHLPPSVEYEMCGTLWIAADDEEMAEVHRKHTLYAETGVHTEILSSAALASAEPNLRRPLAGALLAPSDGVVYPPSAASYFLQQAIHKGAQIYAPRRVQTAAAGRVLLDDGTELQASHIINACGIGATHLLPELPIRKRKGHLVITDRYPDFVRHQLVELGYLKSAHSLTTDSVAFNIQPRKTGQLLIGSSRQYDAEDTAVNNDILSAMLARAQEYIPGIGACSTIRIWTGFRPSTPDKLPLIGPWPKDKTMIVAAGHEGLGITTSTGTARLIADMLSGAQPAISIEPYLPERIFHLQADSTQH